MSSAEADGILQTSKPTNAVAPSKHSRDRQDLLNTSPPSAEKQRTQRHIISGTLIACHDRPLANRPLPDRTLADRHLPDYRRLLGNGLWARQISGRRGGHESDRRTHRNYELHHVASPLCC
jgi:hypothetical protein